MEQVLAFYADPGPPEHRGTALLDGLPSDARGLVHVIQGLGIYDVVAPDFYGVDVPEQRAHEIHHRSVQGMLTAVHALDGAPLTGTRPPDRRLFTRCGGFTRLVVAGLGAHGTPARARCGFAAYFHPGTFADHWVGEVWDAGENRWRLVDAQLDEVWRERLGIDDDVLDISRDRFLVAADAWRRCRAGDADPATFGVTFAGLHGLWFVAGNLVRDLAALNGVQSCPGTSGVPSRRRTSHSATSSWPSSTTSRSCCATPTRPSRICSGGTTPTTACTCPHGCSTPCANVRRTSAPLRR